ncbi:F-box protein [Rhynchospora pubera]|uniref:F-box protein n=1 Tax=Rhynchospora pubera TaxID=906938 RepID=A0AAV8EBE1_9POAL|nr:F-box protein [Rhynchospora pubera]
MENKSTDAAMVGVGDINQLPEECISHVISLTTPRDACVSSAVSRTSHSAADSDVTWERFLPSDYDSILSRAVNPVEYTSKKELYFRLCEHPVLIDGGMMSFGLEKSSGAKCFMISARALSIIWGDDDRYWQWIALPESRFNECAKLNAVCWLEISGKINSNVLSSHTGYVAYLVFKLTPVARGLGNPFQTTKIILAEDTVSEHSVCLNIREREQLNRLSGRLPEGYLEEMTDGVILPRMRRDGWLEVELGEFYSGDGTDGEINMSFMEIRGGHWKNGLIVQGIEVRPNH